MLIQQPYRIVFIITTNTILTLYYDLGCNRDI